MALPALPVTSVAFRLTDEELRNSPSRAHGVDEATEFSLRIYGAELVQEAGILLKQPQAVMATAQVLFQRFYCKRSFVEFNVKRLAAASVFLAAKLEEAHPQVRARDVINVFYRQERRHEGKSLAVLDMFGRRYEELKAELLRCERHMLREFGFLALLEHPHKFVLNYCQLLELPPPVTQTSWALANDSLRTTLCVRFSPEALACGCIFLAARKAAVPLPEEPYSAWWTLFGAHREEVLAIAKVLLVLIDQPKSEYIHVGPSPAGATPPPSPPRPPPPPPQAQAPMPQQGSRGGGGGGGREGRRRSRSRSGERERGRREGRRSRSRSRSRSPRGRRYEEEDRRRRERSRSRSRRRSRSRSRGGR